MSQGKGDFKGQWGKPQPWPKNGKKMNLVNLPKLVNLSNWVEFNFQFIEYLVKFIQYTPLNSCKPYIYRITEFVELLNFAATLNSSTDKNGERLWRVRGRLQRLGREARGGEGVPLKVCYFIPGPLGQQGQGRTHLIFHWIWSAFTSLSKTILASPNLSIEFFLVTYLVACLPDKQTPL